MTTDEYCAIVHSHLEYGAYLYSLWGRGPACIARGIEQLERSKIFTPLAEKSSKKASAPLRSRDKLIPFAGLIEEPLLSETYSLVNRITFSGHFLLQPLILETKLRT